VERSQNPYRYCTLGFDILIFSGLGYILGPQLIGNELIGVLIGAIVGTFVMWAHLWLIIRRMDRIEQETKQHE
jgi:NADH:ubiquinone oxidoreductase subunit 6 (subunit J)